MSLPPQALCLGFFGQWSLEPLRWGFLARGSLGEGKRSRKNTLEIVTSPKNVCLFWRGYFSNSCYSASWNIPSNKRDAFVKPEAHFAGKQECRGRDTGAFSPPPQQKRLLKGPAKECSAQAVMKTRLEGITHHFPPSHKGLVRTPGANSTTCRLDACVCWGRGRDNNTDSYVMGLAIRIDGARGWGKTCSLMDSSAIPQFLN